MRQKIAEPLATSTTPTPPVLPADNSRLLLLRTLPAIVLAAGLALTYVGWHKHRSDTLGRLQDDFDFRIEQSLARIDSRLNSYEQLLEDVAGLFTLAPETDEAGFREYTGRFDLAEKFPGTQAVGYLPYVSAAARDSFVRQQSRRHPGFEIRPPGEREAYGPVLHIEPPSADNLRVFGIDLYAEPVRRASLSKARDEGRTIVSGRLQLVQDEHPGVPGILIATPVFHRGRPSTTPAERQAALQGWVAAPLRVHDLLSGILGEDMAQMTRLLALRIDDVDAQGAAEALYDSQPGVGDGPALFSRTRELQVAGRVWRFHFSSLPPFEERLQSARNDLLAFAGTLASLLLASVLWLVVTGRDRAVRLAARMTDQLRTSKDLLDAVVEGTSDIIFVKDAAGRYQLANRAMHDWLKDRTTDIVGQDDAALFPPDIAEALQAADQATLQSGQTDTRETTLPGPGGTPRTLLLTRGTMRDAAGRIDGIFGIAHDITERKRMERQIALFRSLAEAIGDPVYVIDPHNGFRLVYVNAAACRHFGVPREQLLQQRIADWDARYSDESELGRLWQVVRAKKVVLFESTQKTLSGQTIPVEVLANYLLHESEEYIAGTFRDITRRKRTEEQLQLAASVFQAGSEGVVISDPDGRIVAVNAAFSELTGYSATEAVGQKTSLLRSGRHDPEFYATMWQAIVTTGKWHGEIWNRRKNGEVFPERLSINTIYDADGQVYRRFAIFSDITEQKQAQDVIWHQANYDPLTELPNRRLFRDRLQQEIKRAARGGYMLAVLFIDLDRFKEVNDTLGHDLGDQLLTIAASRIRSCVRESDTVARLGGDEFTLILPEMKDIDRATAVAQAILHAFTAPFELSSGPVYISTSIGITMFPDDGLDDTTLIKHADQAMYATKENGRSGFSFFTPSMQSSVQERIDLANDLRHALARNQLEVYYQPIVELGNDNIRKAEALLRWHHPERGMISPGEFIPIAEETGLIIDIGDWVFRQAAAFAARWQRTADDRASREGRPAPAIQISVNKSPRQFVAEGSGADWADYLDTLGVRRDTIIVEITEGLLLDDQPSISEKLGHLRSAGFKIALDDFGTGYSAMSYLKRFPIDYLKIDRSFVREMESDHNDQAIVEAIVLMAHKLGIGVIAEGVESDGQRTLLSLAECDFAQGYLYGRPQPEQEFLERFAR